MKKRCRFSTSTLASTERPLAAAALFLLVMSAAAVAGQTKDIPRTASGRPDLSGYYNVATLTPLERPVRFGDKLLLTPEEATAIEDAERRLIVQRAQATDGDRDAPPEGGDGSPGAAGNVGGYNYFWIDRGTEVFSVDGKFRTSIITSPENGRKPPLTGFGEEKTAIRRALFPQNEGAALWIDDGGPGPYDNMEQRPLAERCLLGFSSTAGPPMMPAGYNNLKRIVQTETEILILIEMVHDPRVIRLVGEHDPPELRKWLGDSVGRWEGDTLVVETRHFGERPALVPASRNLVVEERFTPAGGDHLKYSFTVTDDTVWTEPWSGEYIWPRSNDKLFEYACHEGNYALGNIMRGARLLEQDRLEALK